MECGGLSPPFRILAPSNRQDFGTVSSRLPIFCARVIFRGGEADMIKKVKGGYKVLSSKGKNLGGPYKTLEEAKKRLRQVEFFKHRKG